MGVDIVADSHRDARAGVDPVKARLGPARIGSELIVLLGLEHLIDGERDLRAKFADAQQRLAVRIDEHEHQERQWAAALAEIDSRDSARSAVAEGKRLWQLRLARKLLDAIGERDRLGEQIAALDLRRTEAGANVRDVEARLAELPDLDGLDEAVTAAEKSGAKFSEADVTAFREAALPLHKDLVKSDLAKKVYDAIEAARG